MTFSIVEISDDCGYSCTNLGSLVNCFQWDCHGQLLNSHKLVRLAILDTISVVHFFSTATKFSDSRPQAFE